jgi:hypothetical protein
MLECICFVSGHDFSRAANAVKRRALASEAHFCFPIEARSTHQTPLHSFDIFRIPIALKEEWKP